MRKAALWFLLLGSLLGSGGLARAQIDPEPRRLLQLGYNQAIEGSGPFSGYAFFYYNQPGFVRTNLTLRAAVAPVYLDSELGFSGLLGEHTDLGIGVAGGGFADSHSEIRAGKWIRDESFTGHAAELSAAVYHLFNPLPGNRPSQSLAEVPLQAVLRGAFRYSMYEEDSRTAANFQLPDDMPAGHLRVGLRWGGREPMVEPPVAVELSAWYEGLFRGNAGTFGFNGDRAIEERTHLFWVRALAAYTFTNTQQRVEISVTAGTSVDADRLGAYRLGGTLPLTSEFPLMLPGYYFEELTARRFAVVNATYSVPITHGFEFITFGGTAVIDYLDGLGQPGSWNSGVGGGLGWTSENGALHVLAGYAYGIDAIRNGHRGAQNVGLLMQYDIGRGGMPRLPGGKQIRSVLSKLNPTGWRGFDGLFRH